jgi:lysine 2,3-aminomutase
MVEKLVGDRIDKQAVLRTWENNPEVYNVLRGAGNVETARRLVYTYLLGRELALAEMTLPVHPLEAAVVRDAIRTMKNITTCRSERLAGFSAIEKLWALAHEDHTVLPQLARGFFEDMSHLLLAVRGESCLYTDKRTPRFVRLKGRKAAIERSRQLDRLYQDVKGYIERYPAGLDPEAVKRRERNRRRILELLGGSEKDWHDARWHFRNVIRDAQRLGRLVELTGEENEAINIMVENHLPFGVTPYYASLMDREPSRVNDHAVRAQVIPSLEYARFMAQHKGERDQAFDFMLEHETSPVELITRRYPSICILKPYNACPQVCVYCQRNWEIEEVMAPDALASPEQLDEALDWIARHEAMEEVLVTGGDPLVMGNAKIDKLLSRLEVIPHVRRIRIGSRIPVTVPFRITDALADILAKYHKPPRREIAFVTHIEHVYEITKDTFEAVQKLRRRGISVYNQQVYTVENSRRFETVALRRLLRTIGVDPYYTFNIKGKQAMEKYRVPIARLLQEQKEEARLLPGLDRTDEAMYNVPGLGKNYLRAMQHHDVIMILPDGSRVYEFHPWEKKISLVDTYVGTDVPIWNYLQKLKSRGERIADYRSIWYYY